MQARIHPNNACKHKHTNLFLVSRQFRNGITLEVEIDKVLHGPQHGKVCKRLDAVVAEIKQA